MSLGLVHCESLCAYLGSVLQLGITWCWGNIGLFVTIAVALNIIINCWHSQDQAFLTLSFNWVYVMCLDAHGPQGFKGWMYLVFLMIQVWIYFPKLYDTRIFDDCVYDVSYTTTCCYEPSEGHRRQGWHNRDLRFLTICHCCHYFEFHSTGHHRKILNHNYLLRSALQYQWS